MYFCDICETKKRGKGGEKTRERNLFFEKDTKGQIKDTKGLAGKKLKYFLCNIITALFILAQ